MTDELAANRPSTRARQVLDSLQVDDIRQSPESTITASIWLPRDCFGAAVEIDNLLREPRLNFHPGRENLLVLLPIAGSPMSLTLAWTAQVDEGTFAYLAGTPSGYTVTQVQRLERWLRDSARRLQRHRAFLRDACTRIMWDAAEGQTHSMPTDDEMITGEMVSMTIEHHVQAPDDSWPRGIVEVDPIRSGEEPCDVFIETATQTRLGTRAASADDDFTEHWERFTVDESQPDLTPDDLIFWFVQACWRTSLWDEAWISVSALLCGLEPPRY